MLARLALRNVRRSARDYGIYFITLVLGVCVFYAFNSISSQWILFDIESSSGSDTFQSVDMFMGMFSVVVAFVLGFLVVYANRFLIRRRKQEFGTYLLLGMTPGQVSSIVLMETAVVGIVSLALGLLVGVGLSQALSFVTAGLFKLEMQQYRFIFSADALVKTVACFVVIFAVVAVLNTFEVRRSNLAALLSARGTSERFAVRSPWVSFVGFVVSVVCLVLAYQALMRSGLINLDFSDNDFLLATVLMLVGTLLFFWSMAGFVLALIQRTRGIYFRGLAMFTMRQIASKVNTAFVSLWVVCVLLFFSVSVFSTGMGLASVFSGDITELTLYDHTLVSNTGSERDSEQEAEVRQLLDENNWDTAGYFASRSDEWSKVVSATAQVNLWSADATTYGDVVNAIGYSIAGTSLENSSTWPTMPVMVVGVSQFNAARSLVGRDPLKLADDEFAVDNTANITSDLASALVVSDYQMTIGGVRLHSSGKLVSQVLAVETTQSETCFVIVPDAVIDALRATGSVPSQSYLDINYAKGVSRADGAKKITQILTQVLPVTDADDLAAGYLYQLDLWPVTYDFSAASNAAQAMGLRMLITYLAIYIGFVLLIATAAILAIQQLSETSDSIGRYRILTEIGCDRRMVVGSMRTQILVYFLVPLALAICHATCVIWVLQRGLYSAFGISSAGPIAMAAVLVVVVYGSYLVVTYLGCRSIVRSSLGKKLLS